MSVESENLLLDQKIHNEMFVNQNNDVVIYCLLVVLYYIAE